MQCKWTFKVWTFVPLKLSHLDLRHPFFVCEYRLLAFAQCGRQARVQLVLNTKIVLNL
jgi:hypothetical protein